MTRAPARRALALALALACPAARAQGAPTDARELAHRVTVVLDRGHARLLAERTIEGDGARPDVAQLPLDWPESAVVRGLALRHHGRWLSASLLDAERADALFATLTGAGAGAAQPTAMVDASGTLSVFPVRAGVRATARVEGVLATTYADGRHTARLPALGSARLPAQVTLLAASPSDRLFVAGEPVAHGATFTAESGVDVALEPTRAPPLTIRVASPSTGRRALLHVDVELAPRLSTRPVRADVVVIIDTSRSRGAGDVEAARAAAATYLARLPDARAQVITFDRRVDVRTDGWRGSDEAQRLLWRLPLVRRNGSELDAALTRAVALFDARGGGAPRRVLVLGDLLTRADLAVAPALRALGLRGVTTHLVAVSARDAGLARDDEHELSSATRVTGGLVWTLGGRAAREAAAVEELVRPVRLDHLTWELPGAPRDELELPRTLAEGEGHQLTRLASRAVAHVSVRGELWATSLAVGAAPSAAGDARWSALALAAELPAPLSSDEQRALARRGHAVSDVTSLIVVPGEARGSRDGHDDGRGLSLTGGPRDSHPGGVGVGRGRVGVLPRVDGASRLRELLSPAWRACGGAGEGTVIVETTLDEVAHARVEALPAVAPGSLGACVVEAAFSLDLSAEFSVPHATWRVRLGDG